jgi:hypothetical protein
MQAQEEELAADERGSPASCSCRLPPILINLHSSVRMH